LIDGWQIILTTFSEGTKATLYIPSVYAYGAQGSGPVPPNASVIFEIELVGIR
jgi:peptidylprolyl isomerase